jgi:DNA-3-methyladenine glycosylase
MSNAAAESPFSIPPCPLPRSFYSRPALQVARDLLGTRLVRYLDGASLSGIILETEAYQGEDDLGCHAHVGRTPRTEVMYGPAGHAYIYFTYGMHWLLNAVTGRVDEPAAVLIRAILPVAGLDRMQFLRPQPAKKSENNPALGWTDGPAKICQALGLTKAQNTADLCDPASGIIIQPDIHIPDEQILTGPRVGLFTVPEPWKSIPWRFRVKESWMDRLISSP